MLSVTTHSIYTLIYTWYRQTHIHTNIHIYIYTTNVDFIRIWEKKHVLTLTTWREVCRAIWSFRKLNFSKIHAALLVLSFAPCPDLVWVSLPYRDLILSTQVWSFRGSTPNSLALSPHSLFLLSVFLYSCKRLLYMMALSFNQSITSACCSSQRNSGCFFLLAFWDASWLGMEDGTSSGAGICIGEIGGSGTSLSLNSDCMGLDALDEWVLSSWSSSSDL